MNTEHGLGKGTDTINFAHFFSLGQQLRLAKYSRGQEAKSFLASVDIRPSDKLIVHCTNFSFNLRDLLKRYPTNIDIVAIFNLHHDEGCCNVAIWIKIDGACCTNIPDVLASFDGIYGIF